MKDILMGKSTTHLKQDGDFWVHHKALDPFRELCEAARKAGFDIRPISVFRPLDGQLAIWNAKARGERSLLDPSGKPLNYPNLSRHEILKAILHWTAVPGASRHHWGTEFDIYDSRALSPWQGPSLTPEESEGPMGAMHSWLDDNLKSFDFFRPYAKDLGGVCPERWHISYRPVSQEYFERYNFQLFCEAIDRADLELAPFIRKEASDIFDRYVRNIAVP
ncbi:MAG: M15 family metallopeptidase [Bacteriovoracales bacterium]|nr:M15 family metallopeptidase [Bacteriovoracales bacterium]